MASEESWHVLSEAAAADRIRAQGTLAAQCWLLSVLALAACGCTRTDGRGTRRVDASAAHDGGPETVRPVCGDGLVSASEACDDGNTAGDDGCSPSCRIEPGWSCAGEPSSCLRIPAPPEIEGEDSAGHPDPVWRWNLPEYTDSFQVRLDAAPWRWTRDREFRAEGLPEGPHVLEVRSCNLQRACSRAASFQTIVEYFGRDMPPVWQGVARTEAAVSPLGNRVFVSCHNCYDGPNDEPYDLPRAIEKIHRALTRGADLVELDVAMADGGTAFCVFHGDPHECGGAPTLEQFLEDPVLQQSDALLFIEIKEQDADPENFALMLLDLLDRHREFVRNGRPLFLRVFHERRAYLHALDAYAAVYPFLAPYLRFSVLYHRWSFATVQEFQQAIQNDAVDPGFHMVEFHYRTRNLDALAQFARRNGLGVGIWTVPGEHGDVHVAAFREEVDELTCEYRVDLARAVVAEENVLAYVDPAGCASSQDATVLVHRNVDGVSVTTAVRLGQPPSGTHYGTPPLGYASQGQQMYGCFFDFRASLGILERAIDLGRPDLDAAGGVLVAAYVNFQDLDTVGTQAILSSAGGFALELSGDGTHTSLRFGVHVGDSYEYRSVSVADTGMPAIPALSTSDAYLVMGAYGADGDLTIWVDGDQPPGHAEAHGPITSSGRDVLLGAELEPSEPTQSRFHLDGVVQRAMVLRWHEHTAPGPAVND